MEPITITVSVISAIAGILTTYREGRRYYKEWRAKKKCKKAAEEEVEDSLELGASKIDGHFTQLSRRHGTAFNQGDGELLRISLDLNQSLVNVLRDSLLSGRTDSIEPQNLWIASEQAQNQTIGAMIDLSQRIQLAAPIPRPLWGRQRSSVASDASNLAPMPFPVQARARPSHSAGPLFPIEAPPSDSRSIGSLQLTPITWPTSALSSFSTISSLSTVSPSLLHFTPLQCPPIFPDTDGKSTSDLLREWKEDLRARSPSQLSPNSPSRSTGFQDPRPETSRFSSAPTTRSLNQESLRPDWMSVRSVQPITTAVELGVGLSIQDARAPRMSSHRVQSDPCVPSSLASILQGNGFPTTSLHKGFTHSLPGSGEQERMPPCRIC